MLISPVRVYGLWLGLGLTAAPVDATVPARSCGTGTDIVGVTGFARVETTFLARNRGTDTALPSLVKASLAYSCLSSLG